MLGSEAPVAEWTATFRERDWAAVEASRRVRRPSDVQIQLDALAEARFSKVLVRGG